MFAKLEMTSSTAQQYMTKYKTPTKQSELLKQLFNNNRTNALEQTSAEATGGLN